MGQMPGDCSQIIRQTRKDALGVEAQFQGWTDVFGRRIIRVGGHAIQSCAVLQRSELTAVNLSRCQDTGVVADDAAHEPFPTSSRPVKPRQPPEAVKDEILPQIVPIASRESEARLQEAGPQRGLLKQVWGELGGWHHRRTP